MLRMLKGRVLPEKRCEDMLNVSAEVFVLSSLHAAPLTLVLSGSECQVWTRDHCVLVSTAASLPSVKLD